MLRAGTRRGARPGAFLGAEPLPQPAVRTTARARASPRPLANGATEVNLVCIDAAPYHPAVTMTRAAYFSDPQAHYRAMFV